MGGMRLSPRRNVRQRAAQSLAAPLRAAQRVVASAFLGAVSAEVSGRELIPIVRSGEATWRGKRSSMQQEVN